MNTLKSFSVRKEMLPTLLHVLLLMNAALGCFMSNNNLYEGSFSLRPSICQKSSIFGKVRSLQQQQQQLPMALSPKTRYYQKTSSQLAMDMRGVGRFFNLNNNSDDSNSGDKSENDESEDYVGCTNIFTIDVKQKLKVGGCRLYLSLFFMGESNNPEKGAWRMNQNGDGGIDLYYKDTTGALIVIFKEHAILVNRLGSSPSMEYLIQESNMLNGMLDQLEEIATDTSIDESDRLLSIEGDKINMVRETLSFT